MPKTSTAGQEHRWQKDLQGSSSMENPVLNTMHPPKMSWRNKTQWFLAMNDSTWNPNLIWLCLMPIHHFPLALGPRRLPDYHRSNRCHNRESPPKFRLEKLVPQVRIKHVHLCHITRHLALIHGWPKKKACLPGIKIRNKLSLQETHIDSGAWILRWNLINQLLDQVCFVDRNLEFEIELLIGWIGPRCSASMAYKQHEQSQGD